MLVVDLLEVVEVEDGQRDAIACRLGGTKHRRQVLGEGAAGERAGQRVDADLLCELRRVVAQSRMLVGEQVLLATQATTFRTQPPQP